MNYVAIILKSEDCLLGLGGSSTLPINALLPSIPNPTLKEGFSLPHRLQSRRTFWRRGHSPASFISPLNCRFDYSLSKSPPPSLFSFQSLNGPPFHKPSPWSLPTAPPPSSTLNIFLKNVSSGQGHGLLLRHPRPLTLGELDPGPCHLSENN